MPIMPPRHPLEVTLTEKLELLARATGTELTMATSKYGAIRGQHEALGIIREEYLEFEDEVRKRNQVQWDMAKELLQIAAMCWRTIIDLDLMPFNDYHFTAPEAPAEPKVLRFNQFPVCIPMPPNKEEE